MPTNFIPPNREDELNKLLGLPPREKPKKRAPGTVRVKNPDGTEGELRVEGLPDPFADVTDPKIKKFLDEVAGEFDGREY